MIILKEEYAPFYESYIELVPNDLSIREAFIKTFERIKLFLQGLSDERLTYAYESGKWTLAEVLQHCLDVERILATRALKIARGEKSALPPFNEDEYAALAKVGNKPVAKFIEEWELLRRSNVLLFESFDETSLLRKTIVWKHEASARAMAAIIIGHGLHHINIIEERYL